MSLDLFDQRHIARARRMKHNNRDWIPTRHTRPGDSGNLQNFRGVVARNIDRARRRWQRLRISPISEEVGDPSSVSG